MVRKALDGWVGEGALTAEQRQQLLQHVAVQPFDWRRLARYAFLAALASLLIAVTSLFADSALLEWLSELFRFDAPVRMAIAGILAALAYVWALRRRRHHRKNATAMRPRCLSPCCLPPAPYGSWGLAG